jgi:hypothetical protein
LAAEGFRIPLTFRTYDSWPRSPPALPEARGRGVR